MNFCKNPFDFESLLRNGKNIFFAAFIKRKGRLGASFFVLAGALTLASTFVIGRGVFHMLPKKRADILSVLILREPMHLTEVIGAVLILGAAAASELGE